MKTFWVYLVVALYLSAIPGGAQAAWLPTTRNLVAEGNKAYNAGDYGTALQRYQQAAKRSPDVPQVQFDLGNALYKSGDFAGATTAYERAAKLSDDPTLISRSKYNMANSVFQEAEKLRQTDLGTALQSYEQSADFYRTSLDNDPDFNEAARNLEVSKRRIAIVKQEMQKQPQDKQPQDQQNKNKEQGDEKQQSQDSGADKNDKDDKQQAADKSSDDGQKGDQQDKQESPEKKDSAKGGDEQKDEKSAQDKSAEAGQDKKKEDAASSGQQNKADDEAEDGKQAQSVADGNKQESGVAISAEELLNEEKENSMKRQQYRAGRYQDVEKDW